MRAKAFLAVVSLTAPSQVAAADQLCDRMRTFEASESPDGRHTLERSWFEFHWGFDRHAIWSWGCRHSSDASAKNTCAWLMQHTNQEFSMILPQKIMSCYGYVFPKRAHYDWNSLAGTIILRGRSDRRLLMDLSYRDLPSGEVAVRVALERPDESYEPEVLSPIEPMSKVTREDALPTPR